MTALGNLVYVAATVTIIGAIPSAARAADWMWRQTRPGRRRALRHTLDKLSCGSTRGFVDELLGPPKFITSVDGRPQQIHRLDGAWVAVETIDSVVLSFSITITNPKLAYPIDAQTHLMMDCRLGRDSFANILDSLGKEIQPDGQFLWIGAYRWGYIESYYHGRPGAHQQYWLSHNMAGAGGFDPDSTSTFTSGAYEGHNYLGTKAQAGTPPNRASMIVNTLTVMNPDVRRDPGTSIPIVLQFLARPVVGTDSEILRLDVSQLRHVRHRPTASTRRFFSRRRPT